LSFGANDTLYTGTMLCRRVAELESALKSVVSALSSNVSTSDHQRVIYINRLLLITGVKSDGANCGVRGPKPPFLSNPRLFLLRIVDRPKWHKLE